MASLIGFPTFPLGNWIFSKEETVGAMSVIKYGLLDSPCRIPHPIKINGMCAS